MSITTWVKGVESWLNTKYSIYINLVSINIENL